MDKRKQPRILAIDDEQTILLLLRRTLEIAGYDVITSGDSRLAQSLMEEYKPDLVILDIMMPGLDGFQVLNLVRQRSNVPVIMLSARREVETKHDAMMLGADDFIEKPFQPGELVARIRAKLRRAGLETPRP